MSAGWIPTPVRSVKPFVAVVQPGDSVSRIAHRMTGSPSRWPELVGANLHKPMSPGNVAGSPYRVFSDLQPGEHLMVPASWPNPGSGSVGVIPKQSQYINERNAYTAVQQEEPSRGGQIDPFGGLITTIVTGLGTTNTLPTPPAGLGLPDVANVIAAWYPYIPPGIIPGLSTPPSPAIPGSVEMWIKLIESATAFLSVCGLTPSQIDWLTKIPWDNNMPWAKIPWQQLIVSLDPVMRLPFWQLLIGAASGTGPIVTKPSLNTPAGQDAKIDFFDPSTWTKEPFASVNQFGWANFLSPSQQIMPDDMPGTWGKIDDMELLGCIAGNPQRAAELADPKYAACFKSDMTKLKLYMCNPKLDATKCAVGVDPKNPPIPIVPPGVNWACQPSPACIAEQLNKLGVQDPCSPMPTCIPEWYKTITGQNVPPPPAEDKKDTNLPLYLGLGAAGIALVAGILVIAAAD